MGHEIAVTRDVSWLGEPHLRELEADCGLASGAEWSPNRDLTIGRRARGLY